MGDARSYPIETWLGRCTFALALPSHVSQSRTPETVARWLWRSRRTRRGRLLRQLQTAGALSPPTPCRRTAPERINHDGSLSQVSVTTGLPVGAAGMAAS